MEALQARPDDKTTLLPNAKSAFNRGGSRCTGWLEDPNEDPNFTFPAVPGRYHVFVNYGCGWCHQLLQVLHLRGVPLCGKSGVGVTHVGIYRRGQRGTPDYQGYVLPVDNTGLGLTCMRDVYNVGCDGTYGGEQLTIPVLFDTVTKRVVSNDSAQILLMIDFLADKLGSSHVDNAHVKLQELYPEAMREEIECVNRIVWPGINNGVYLCWFASYDLESDAFKEGFEKVQNALDWVEEQLKIYKGKFMLGTTEPTLADVRAFPHLLRFDLIYHRLMLKGRGKRIFRDLPHTAQWIRDVMYLGVPNLRTTCDLQVATRFYFSSLPVVQSDAIYEEERQKIGGESWLPTLTQWAEKRAAEGITEEQLDIPTSA